MYILFTIVLLFFGYPTSNGLSDNINNRLNILDSYIQHKKNYSKLKEERIEAIRVQLKKTSSNEKRYHLYINLYNEYKSYMYDSAYVYANRSLQIAMNLNNKEYKVESHCSLVFCLLSAGLYAEAVDAIKKIDITNVSKKYIIQYYLVRTRLNYDLADYNHVAPYQQVYVSRGNLYTDSLLTLIPAKSTDWWYAIGQRQMKNYKYECSVQTFLKLLKIRGIDIHTKAIATSCIGWMYWKLGDENKAIEYLTESAEYDLISSTKETTALKVLAELLYKNGDIKHAAKYIQLSLDDANFYNARQRKIEVGEILSIIEQNRYNIIKTRSNILIGGITLSTILGLIMLTAFFIIYKQKKKLQNARSLIIKRNTQLGFINQQLSEANKIKDEYIGNSFYVNAEFIEKAGKLYRMVDRKIAAHQYDDLRNSLKESTLNKERENMYTAFDTTFLKLFPSFVTEYNKLFANEENKHTDNGQSLTPEMRIFALIRLGISNSERIAKFLNYSAHTINTYKTRVKNKSIIGNDSFENKIMEIGTVKSNDLI